MAGFFIIFLVAILPVIELRGAIPIGITQFQLHPWIVFIAAVLGSTVPVLLVYGFLEWWIRFAHRKQGFIHHITEKILIKTEQKMHSRLRLWSTAALIGFVAIPFPGTGAWTGSLGAFLLRLPFRTAITSIIIGNTIAGVIMLAATTGIIKAFHFID